MIQPKRYRLYIDESGDHTYNLMDEPEHRFLALLGVWVEQDEHAVFAKSLENLKCEIFGSPQNNPIVLHRSDIINRKKAFGSLRDPLVQKAFDDRLCDLIDLTQFCMICVVIDKLQNQQQYASPFHPYHYCQAALIDRYSSWLNYRNAVGDVMAEARGVQEDRQLAQAYQRVYESGTLMFSHKHYQRALTSKELKFSKKYDNVAGLQLADILAHPVKSWVLAQAGKIQWSPSPFASRLLALALPKLNCDPKLGNTEGYGTVVLPK